MPEGKIYDFPPQGKIDLKPFFVSKDVRALYKNPAVILDFPSERSVFSTLGGAPEQF